jgi:hypothetical protein
VLVRLAADSGARRGELAARRLSDLDGRVLTIERSLSGGVASIMVPAYRRRPGVRDTWLPDLLMVPVPVPQNEMVPEPATVISCARNAPGLGSHGFASTSFSVRVTGKPPRIPR